MRRPVPIDLARDRLNYSPESGELRWKSGEATGSVSKGYLRIKLGGISLQAHRIAWAMHYGEQPPQELDHKNQIKDDNRISNLRVANRSQNCINSKARSPRSGYKGAYASRTPNRWFARIMVRGQSLELGSFDTAEEAGLAYEVAAERFFGVFAPQQS